MPLDWRPFDSFDWAGSSQARPGDGERAAVEAFVADLLGLSPADRAGAWGAASPPGRYAATVVRVARGVGHRFSELAARSGVAEVGVKVFKTTRDARREAAGLVPFHRDLAHRLPGLPLPHVQRSLAAGGARDPAGAERAWVVQEWVAGDSLEDLVRRVWPGRPPGSARVRSLLGQLHERIVFPLWSAGTVWWDVRDANFVLDEEGRLSLIDLDSLAACAAEALGSPGVWQGREKARATALPRLRRMAVRLVLAQGLRPRGRAEAVVATAWEAHLGPVLGRLGREPVRRDRQAAALAAFLAALEAGGLLAAAS